MTPVTDPAILAQLNAPQPVTDPAILAQLNGQEGGGFVDNVSNAWDKRKNQAMSAGIMGLTDQQSLPETALQIAGQGAGAINDAVGEGINRLIPQSYINGAHSIADNVNNTSVGRTLGDTLMGAKDSINSIRDNHPRLARNADSLANVLSLGTGSKGVADIEGVGAELGLGDALYNSGKAAQNAAHQSFVGDLILPKQTPTVKAEMAQRMQQINGKNIYQPTIQEQQIASTVKDIPGISSSNSNVKNLNIIQDANKKEAEALKQRLEANDVPISDDVIQNSLLNIKDTLSKSTNISGPGEAVVSRVVNAGLDHISTHPQTAAGMLEARKAFDNQMIRERGEGILDAAVESPRSNAVQQVRQAMNAMVADAVPSAEVRASLQKQSHLFQAADNISVKASGEAATRLGRVLQRNMPKNLAEGAKDIGAVYAAAKALPYIPTPVLGAGLAGYGMYKAATSPRTRMMLGKALGVSDVAP